MSWNKTEGEFKVGIRRPSLIGAGKGLEILSAGIRMSDQLHKGNILQDARDERGGVGGGVSLASLYSFK